MHVKLILEYSPHTFIPFTRILHACLNTFGVFEDDFVYIKSPKTLRNLRVRVKNFGKFSN